MHIYSFNNAQYILFNNAQGASLANYKAKSWRARKANLEELTFHRTWCANQGRGKATIIPLASASQGAARLLVDMENPHCRVGSNSPCQRSNPHDRRKVVTWLSEHRSEFTNPASFRCSWRLIAVCGRWKGSSSDGDLFSLFVAQASSHLRK